MDNYPSNSLYFNSEQKKEEPERLDPVVDVQNVVSTKKPLTKRFHELMFRNNIVDNVIIPGMFNIILDAMENMFFGRSSGRFNNSNPFWNSYNYDNPSYYMSQSYNNNNGYGYNYSQPYQNNQPQHQPFGQMNKVDYRNIILRRKEDADAVINQMVIRIRESGRCTVADLLDLVNVPGEYTDNNWGWRNMRGVGIQRVSQGFLIVVPEAMPLTM